MKRAAIAAILLAAAFYGLWQLSRSRTFQLFGEIVSRVETEDRVVAITFDDGPVAETAGEILATLDLHGAKATFFVCGAQFQGAEGVAEQLVAAGHELGNHSWSHVRMVFKSPAFIRSEFERTDALIRATGHSGPIHVRAPYGKKLIGLPWYFAKNERIHVTFDVEPESDPEIDRDAARIAAHVLDTVRPGSIVLLHTWYRSRNRTREALPEILEGLRARGYTFVTVSELLAMRPGRTDAGARVNRRPATG